MQHTHTAFLLNAMKPKLVQILVKVSYAIRMKLVCSVRGIII